MLAGILAMGSVRTRQRHVAGRRRIASISGTWRISNSGWRKQRVNQPDVVAANVVEAEDRRHGVVAYLAALIERAAEQLRVCAELLERAADLEPIDRPANVVDPHDRDDGGANVRQQRPARVARDTAARTRVQRDKRVSSRDGGSGIDGEGGIRAMAKSRLRTLSGPLAALPDADPSRPGAASKAGGRSSRTARAATPCPR